ncbi:glycogenin-1 isoform X2 [Nematostella vectensis]|uniref:glycogenin-1 isoform X2 n=1 Tax=Nematostella vectensis TaxID=45351 RepID=UPI0020779046|nr:glycogenin-1 isoform X2 [Nematostella vectensis]
MAGNRPDSEAFVSLVTNDNYANGALVLGYSLRRVNTTRKLALLVTNQVSEGMREQLLRVWDHLETVDPLDSQDDANLALLSRPELGITFTKIRCWNLTHYQKCVFMDADMLVLQNCDELFDRCELSAVPDIGWPDCFNSGMFVFEPSRATHEALLKYAIDHGSFDGGDQGLLNSFFSQWSHEDISTHLSFIYNMNSNASYTYAPAYKEFGKNVKIVHFIGPVKPWQYSYSETSSTAYVPSSNNIPHERSYIQLWWDIYNTFVLPGMRQCGDCSTPPSPVHPYYHEPSPSDTPYIPTPDQFEDSTYHHEHSRHPVSDYIPEHDVPDKKPEHHVPDNKPEHHIPDYVPTHSLDSEDGPSNPSYFTDEPRHTEDNQLSDKIDHLPNMPAIPEEGSNGHRKQWENGRPDYNGRDSFPNIQNVLDSVLEGENRPIEDVPEFI